MVLVATSITDRASCRRCHNGRRTFSSLVSLRRASPSHPSAELSTNVDHSAASDERAVAPCRFRGIASASTPWPQTPAWDDLRSSGRPRIEVVRLARTRSRAKASPTALKASARSLYRSSPIALPLRRVHACAVRLDGASVPLPLPRRQRSTRLSERGRQNREGARTREETTAISQCRQKRARHVICREARRQASRYPAARLGA